MEDIGSNLASLDFDLSSEAAVACILCEDMFTVTQDPQIFFQHLLSEHNFVIGSNHEIADIRQYVLYWGKLKYHNLEDFCVVYLTNTEPEAPQPSDTFYLLCDKLPEDKQLRLTLRNMKIKYLTEQKEKDRADLSFSRKCIYCNKIIEGGLSNCFTHLTFDHKFSLGNPDNIVFGAKLLDLLEQQLQSLKCLYCEGKFKNHMSLREHMRKKQHRSLNPKNKLYDKFYLLNYLKPGTPWEVVKQDLEKESESSYNLMEDKTLQEDELWTDWREEEARPCCCLFCSFTTAQGPSGVYHHMTDYHNFNFEVITRHYSFYQKVKIINFIRERIKNMTCPLCSTCCSDNHSLMHHMTQLHHFLLPPQHCWDNFSYLQPVLENDELLFYLEDNNSDDDQASLIHSISDDEVVLPEDYDDNVTSILSDASVRLQITEPDAGPLDPPSMCLFCRFTATGVNAQGRIYNHMNTIHSFNFVQVTRALPFYSQVKLINYIRLCTGKSVCYFCGKYFTSTASIEEHRVNEAHNLLPEQHVFKDDCWLRPVLQEDGLLQNLCEDSDEEDDEGTNIMSLHPQVIGEEIRIPPSILSDPALRQEILQEMTKFVQK